MTWLAAICALIPFTLGAVTVALAARDDLIRAGRQYLDESVREASPLAFDSSSDLRTDIPALAKALGRDGRLEVSDQIYPGRAALNPHTQPPLSGSLLSLWPWTDPASRRPLYAMVNGQSETYTNPLLVASNPLRYEQNRLNDDVLALAGCVLVGTAAVAGVAWFAAGRVLRPVEAIRIQFAELSAGHLDRRVPVPRTRDEVARLAETMNSTLERLQSSVDRQRAFVSDASHELRSPLAALRAELEIALAHPGTVEWTAVAQGALGDARRLEQLTTDLLLLARLDAALPGTERFDLVALVHDETRRRRTPARLRLRVEADPSPVVVDGHRGLLARLLANLLDNAERHAATTVTVIVARTELHVQDDGPGIAPADRRRVFERFTRLDDARTRETGGTGLGLAIAHRIATAHGATLSITDSERGARFTLKLPMVPRC
ncbi:sensor histidine kinase [Streptomyces sp. NPDC020379]|uniref:sensor histidine kinase n=1 Tax=Streptomyces sp. NPDC020379 TaxID=3365071 RepID=UPI00378DA7A4